MTVECSIPSHEYLDSKREYKSSDKLKFYHARLFRRNETQTLPDLKALLLHATEIFGMLDIKSWMEPHIRWYLDTFNHGTTGSKGEVTNLPLNKEVIANNDGRR